LRHLRHPAAVLVLAPLFALGFGCATGAARPAGDDATAAPAADMESTCRAYAQPNGSGVNPPRQLSGEQPQGGDWPAGSYACVRVTINTAGSVVDPVVVKTNSDGFAKAFVRALGSWQYEPATRGTAKAPFHTALLARAPGG
jgi:hypothetical protein